ncbi:hypothetical protein PIIN_08929 [Serendipita indica DSM 11827]|uniref:Uncharacterized protein n=1 Tax=Serendipita indica (strain DSM 11827) TaxID=1109443 RepID=G4TUF6_SERID|nr:hypothetical protein PIIN_08929 [Serendipita indica DSM 11827]
MQSVSARTLQGGHFTWCSPSKSPLTATAATRTAIAVTIGEYVLDGCMNDIEKGCSGCEAGNCKCGSK